MKPLLSTFHLHVKQNPARLPHLRGFSSSYIACWRDGFLARISF